MKKLEIEVRKKRRRKKILAYNFFVMIKTLAIETSCDDTSVGVITYDEGIFNVEKLLAYSQISDHIAYG
ncbi:MAG: hypothetical protein ACOZBL_05605 [Patescibacteria group bacterium]